MDLFNSFINRIRRHLGYVVYMALMNWIIVYTLLEVYNNIIIGKATDMWIDGADVSSFINIFGFLINIIIVIAVVIVILLIVLLAGLIFNRLYFNRYDRCSNISDIKMINAYISIPSLCKLIYSTGKLVIPAIISYIIIIMTMYILTKFRIRKIQRNNTPNK